jgi:hypothetical protein
VLSKSYLERGSSSWVIVSILLPCASPHSLLRRLHLILSRYHLNQPHGSVIAERVRCASEVRESGTATIKPRRGTIGAGAKRDASGSVCSAPKPTRSCLSLWLLLPTPRLRKAARSHDGNGRIGGCRGKTRLARNACCPLVPSTEIHQIAHSDCLCKVSGSRGSHHGRLIMIREIRRWG